MPDSLPASGPLGCLVRLLWMAVGNLILVLSLIAAVQGGARGFRTGDLVFWLTVAGLLAIRWADIRYLNGTTTDGQPASMAHWRRYAVQLVGLAAVAWLAVHAGLYWKSGG